eukprot:6214004-Amphidinium_carterae.1
MMSKSIPHRTCISLIATEHKWYSTLPKARDTCTIAGIAGSAQAPANLKGVQGHSEPTNNPTHKSNITLSGKEPVGSTASIERASPAFDASSKGFEF